MRRQPGCAHCIWEALGPALAAVMAAGGPMARPRQLSSRLWKLSTLKDTTTAATHTAQRELPAALSSTGVVDSAAEQTPSPTSGAVLCGFTFIRRHCRSHSRAEMELRKHLAQALPHHACRYTGAGGSSMTMKTTGNDARQVLCGITAQTKRSMS